MKETSGVAARAGIVSTLILVAAASLPLSPAAGLASAPVPTGSKLVAHGPPSEGDVTSGYGVNPGHTGSLANDPLAPPLRQAWSVTLGSLATYASAPVAAEGKVVVSLGGVPGSTFGAVIEAFSASDGSLAWGPYDIGANGWLAYDRGAVFELTLAGLLQAYDIASGRLLWARQFVGGLSPPTAVGGIVYFTGGGEPGGVLYAVRDTDGADAWPPQPLVGYSYDSGPSVAATDSTAYVLAGGCEQAYAFNAATGAQDWHHDAPCHYGEASPPVLYGCGLYVESNGQVPSTFPGEDVILDPQTGDLVGPEPGALASVPLLSTPVFWGSMAYYITVGGLLRAVDLRTGSVSWEFEAPFPDEPLVVNGYVYVPDAGYITVLNAITGAVVDRVPGGLSQPMAVSGGALFVVDNGRLTAFTGRGPAGPPPTGDPGQCADPTPPPGATPAPSAASPVPADFTSFRLAGSRHHHHRSADATTTYQIDPAHDGSLEHDALKPPLLPAWSRDLGGTVSYPLVAQGMVFVTVGFPSTLTAIDDRTGRTLWSRANPGGTPAYDRGHLFLAGSDSVSSVDASSGTITWTRVLPGARLKTPVATDGRIYALSWSPTDQALTLYILDEATGNMIATQQQPGDAGQSPYIADLPVVGDGKVLAGIGPGPTVYGDRLYITQGDALPGRASDVVDVSTGRPTGLTFSSRTTPVFWGSLGFFSYRIVKAEDISTARIVWTFDQLTIASPIVVSGVLYVPTANGLYALSAGRGKVLWSWPLPGMTQSLGLAAGDGTLVVAGPTGLTAFRNLPRGMTPAPTPTPTPAPTPVPSPTPTPLPANELGPPTNVVAHPLGGGQVELTWTPPSPNANGPVSHYQFLGRCYHAEAGGGGFLDNRDGDVSVGTSYVLMGLSVGDQCAFTLEGGNPAWGAWSAYSAFIEVT